MNHKRYSPSLGIKSALDVALNHDFDEESPSF